MNLNDLQRVNIEEASTLLNIAFNTSIEVYFIETNSGKPTLLSIGDLEKIRKVFPRKEQILLPSSSPGPIRPFNWVGPDDLMICKTDYQEIFEKNAKSNVSEKKLAELTELNLLLPPELLNNVFLIGILKKSANAILLYREWREKNDLKKNMISLVVEPMLQSITQDTREIEFLKKVLKSIFEELE